MKRFKKVYIEITNQCNLACDFCPLTTRTADFLEFDNMRRILKEVRPYTDYVYFHLMGEPLLHPELGRYLELAHEEGLKVNLTTNGTLLKHVGMALLNYPALRQVNVSLTSFGGNTQQMSVLERETTLNRYLTEVIDFTKAAEETERVIVSLRLWNLNRSEDTESALNEAEMPFEQNRLNTWIIRFLERAFQLSEGKLEQTLLHKSGLKLAEGVYLNTADYFEWPDIEREPFGCSGFCYGLRDQIGILTNGTVVPCCLDGDGHIALGNIYEMPLEQILNSKRAKAIYDGFSSRTLVEPLCQRCGYARQF